MTLFLLAGIAAIAVMAMSRGGGRTMSEWYVLDQANANALIGDQDRKSAWEAAGGSLHSTLATGGRQLAPILMSVRRVGDNFLVTFRLINIEGMTNLDAPAQVVGDVIYTVSGAQTPGYGLQILQEDWPLPDGGRQIIPGTATPSVPMIGRGIY